MSQKDGFFLKKDASLPWHQSGYHTGQLAGEQSLSFSAIGWRRFKAPGNVAKLLV